MTERWTPPRAEQDDTPTRTMPVTVQVPVTIWRHLLSISEKTAGAPRVAALILELARRQLNAAAAPSDSEETPVDSKHLRAVLTLWIDGKRGGEIAAELGLTPKQVSTVLVRHRIPGNGTTGRPRKKAA